MCIPQTKVKQSVTELLQSPVSWRLVQARTSCPARVLWVLMVHVAQAMSWWSRLTSVCPLPVCCRWPGSKCVMYSRRSAVTLLRRGRFTCHCLCGAPVPLTTGGTAVAAARLHTGKFAPKKALVLTKFSRYEFEKKRHGNIPEVSCEFVIYGALLAMNEVLCRRSKA